MVWSRSYGTSSEEWVRKTTPFFENTRVLPRRFRVDANEIKACLCAVLEEDEIDDFTQISVEPERSTQDANYGLTLRELLFDETD